MKALYKVQRDEEAAAAAIADPPEPVSPQTPVTKGEPRLNIVTKPFDVVDNMLEGLSVTIPLKQLLQQAPNIHQQCGELLGFSSKARASKSLLKSKWNPDNMDLDKVNLLEVDTSESEAVTVALQAVYAPVDDEILEFLMDGGAMT